MNAEFSIEEVQPDYIRDLVVDFYWDQRRWHYDTIEQYRRNWRWLHRSMGDGKVRVWVARTQPEGAIVGHIAVYPRKYRLEGHDLDVVLPGNLIVHPEYRNTLIGPRLVMQPRAMVRRGEADAVLAFANANAHPMFLRLGFRDLGSFVHFTDVFRWSNALRRRFAPAAVAAPLLDFASEARRRWLSRSDSHSARSFLVRELSPADIRKVDVSHWVLRRSRMEAVGSGHYVAGRFLECPYADRVMLGLFDRTQDVLEGYVVVSRSAPALVWDCRVNHAKLDIVTAIQIVAGSLTGADTLTVPALPGSRLASDLKRRGFLERRPDATEHWWSAYWRDDHPLARSLANSQPWDLFLGSTHH